MIGHFKNHFCLCGPEIMPFFFCQTSENVQFKCIWAIRDRNSQRAILLVWRTSILFCGYFCECEKVFLFRTEIRRRECSCTPFFGRGKPNRQWWGLWSWILSPHQSFKWRYLISVRCHIKIKQEVARVKTHAFDFPFLTAPHCFRGGVSYIFLQDPQSFVKFLIHS